MNIQKFIKCTTLEEIIEYGKSLQLSHSKLHTKDFIFDPYTKKTTIFNTSNILERYMDKVNKLIKEYEFTETEYQKYIYKPKMFCLDIYGDIELWSLLLNINNMISITEFNKKKIKIFTKEIFDFINEVIILEEPNLIINDDYIESAIKKKKIVNEDGIVLFVNDR